MIKVIGLSIIYPMSSNSPIKHLPKINLSPIAGILILILVLQTIIAIPVNAQTNPYPIYVVQEKDTLNSIALTFGVSTQDLIAANPMSNPDFLSVGAELNIPGLDDVSGYITTRPAGIGETLDTLTDLFMVSRATLVKLNKITNPSELFIGAPVIIPVDNQKGSKILIGSIPSSGNLLSAAILAGVNPWQILLTRNESSTSGTLLPGQMLTGLSEAYKVKIGTELISQIEIAPLPLTQGHTAVVRVKSIESVELSGKLNGSTLNFVDGGDGYYYALQGIHAMSRIGMGTFEFRAKSETNSFSFSQGVLIASGNYPLTQTINVDPATLDDENTKPEDELIANIVRPATNTKYWDGQFVQPMDEPICNSSYFGARRSYNSGPYKYYHTGLDYVVCTSTLEFKAVAPGKVVFAEETTVRGNATIIDHGWGVYSGYWHQSKLLVNTGDFVEAGQVIGEVGTTGRSTGPHLHLEIIVGGNAVDPFDWLDQSIPSGLFARE